jgi:hypothetical protein
MPKSSASSKVSTIAAQIVDLARDQLLACPRLAFDQDGEIRRGDALDPLADPADPGTRPDQRRGAIRLPDLRPASTPLFDLDQQGGELRADGERAALPVVDGVRWLEFRLETDRNRPRRSRDVEGDTTRPLPNQGRVFHRDRARAHDRAQLLFQPLPDGPRLADDRQSARDRRQKRGRRRIRRGALRLA